MNEKTQRRFPGLLRKFFGKWNAFEIILLVAGFALSTAVFCIGKEKDSWALFSSLTGIVCVLFTAKGNPAAQYISVVFALLYAFVSFRAKYYGETLIYLFLMIPIHAACIFSWIRNRKSPEVAEVKINSLSAREYLLMGASDVAVTVLFYFLLKFLGTQELIVSTISLVSSVSAAYLMLRRSEYYAVCFIVNDLILLVLWGLRVYRFGASALPTLVTFAVFLVNDVYGFLSWKKRKRLQNKELESAERICAEQSNAE